MKGLGAPWSVAGDPTAAAASLRPVEGRGGSILFGGWRGPLCWLLVRLETSSRGSTCRRAMPVWTKASMLPASCLCRRLRCACLVPPERQASATVPRTREPFAALECQNKSAKLEQLPSRIAGAVCAHGGAGAAPNRSSQASCVAGVSADPPMDHKIRAQAVDAARRKLNSPAAKLPGAL